MGSLPKSINYLSRFILHEILKNNSLREISCFSLTNKRMHQNIYQDDDFWFTKFMNDFGETCKPVGSNWKFKYINALTEISLQIEYIKNPSEDIQLAAIKRWVGTIKYIKNPSETLKLTAVTQNGYAIAYIDNPSEELQLAAVNSNGCSIKYIDNPSEKVQRAAVNNNERAIEYIDNLSNKLLSSTTPEGENL